MNGYIRNKADAGNPPTIRNLSDVAQANVLAEPVDEVARYYDRMARERGRELLRERIDGDAKEFAFRVAVRNLNLTPQQISDLVPRLFALLTEERPVEESEAATTTSATEESEPAITLP